MTERYTFRPNFFPYLTLLKPKAAFAIIIKLRTKKKDFQIF